jgi:adenosine deaminase
MSSDLQRAASVFGCDALLHVILNETVRNFTDHFKTPAHFLSPIPKEYKDAVTPIVISGYPRNPAMDIDDGTLSPVAADHFPLPKPLAGGEMKIDLSHDKLFLTETIDRLLNKSAFLYCHYASRMKEGEKLANFMALYGLPTDMIQKLRDTRIGVLPEREDQELAFLQKLPKTDLHCHLGGIAWASEIIAIAAANRPEIEIYHDVLSPWRDYWKRRIRHKSLEKLHFQTSESRLCLKSCNYTL